MSNDQNMAKVSFVFFGPANVGKSTLIGFIKAHSLSEDKFINEINKIRNKLGNVYRTDRLYSYFVDNAKDEYTRNVDNIHGETKGTSKYAHITKIGDFFLIDTPGGDNYEVQRYKGISLANIGIFAIEIKQLLNLQEKNSDGNLDKYLETVKHFFSSWFVWQKMHGTKNAIILLTKYDSYPSENYFNKAKSILFSMIGEDKDINIIPTSIDVKTECRNEINIYTKLDCDWYTGKTLIQAIEEKHSFLTNNPPSELLMFYNRKFDNVPGIGIIIKWKISDGYLDNHSIIMIAPVIVNKKYSKIMASIKSMHNEDNVNIRSANAGEIVNIALSNIIYENTKIQRDEVEILNTSIIVNSDRTIKMGDHIIVKLDLKNCAKQELIELKQFKINTQVRVLWFGKVIFPNICFIKPTNEEELILELYLSDNQIALPIESFPKKVLLQNKPKNKFELINNYDCLVTDIYYKNDNER